MKNESKQTMQFRVYVQEEAKGGILICEEYIILNGALES